MQDKIQILKVIGAGAVVLAALVIMWPGIVDYLASLSRLAVYVSIAILAAVSLSFVFRQFKKNKSPSNESK